MAITDEQIRLILDIVGAKSVDELTKLLGAQKIALVDVANTYEVLASAAHGYELVGQDIVRTTQTQTVAVRRHKEAVESDLVALQEQARAQKIMQAALAEAVPHGVNFGRMMEQNKFRILEAGRAVQDFAQGGIAGILNNIERLVGGSGALAGILTGVGVAAYIAAPYMKKWAQEMGAMGEKFEVPIKGTEALTEAINKNKKALEELREKEKLTYFELLEYTKKVGELKTMEEDLATSREARAVKAGSSKKEQARGAAVRETIAERFGSGEELIESIMQTEGGKLSGLKTVEGYVAGAQKGFGGDIMSLGNLFPKFKEAYTPFSPEAKEQFKQAQEGLKQEGEMLAARKKDRELRDKMWQQEGEEADKEKTKQGHEDFRRFTRRMQMGKQERLAREREGKQEEREGQRTQRQARAQQVHGLRGQERELNQRDDDIVQGRAELRENAIQSARDRGESKQVIADMLQMSRQAARSDAAEKEFWRRERAKYVESVQGGGNQ